jgi:hypothetical protein
MNYSNPYLSLWLHSLPYVLNILLGDVICVTTLAFQSRLSNQPRVPIQNRPRYHHFLRPRRQEDLPHQRGVLLSQGKPADNTSDGVGRNIIPIDKTYDNRPTYRTRDIIIDQEGAMLSFFHSREEWLPLFRSVAGIDLPKDTVALFNSIASTSASATNTIATNTIDGDLPLTLHDLVHSDINDTRFPWKRFDAIPSSEADRGIVARFLDSMQESLLAIPVVEDASRISYMSSSNLDGDDEDENDVQFVEEGRRLLAINRFHVLNNTNHTENGTQRDHTAIESVDELFRYCWSEILFLSKDSTVNSGSIILLPPQYELSYLRRFIDMNVVQPLQWLGIHNDFEVSSFQRDSPAIRLIYKLNDIPTKASYTEEDGFAASN